MFVKFLLSLMHLLETLTGALLSGVSVSIQLANIFVCLLILIAGPALVLGHLAR
jgi:hypothetical protein